MSPYAASKLATEQYCLAWQHTYQLPTLAFRFFNVFGPHQLPGHAYAAVVPAFAYAALRGEDLVIHDDGSQTRDFTYVGTVCEVIQTAINESISSPTPVNLAFGSRISLQQVIEELESLLGHSLGKTFQPARIGDVKHSQADNSRLLELFPGVEPVPFRKGLEETIAWMTKAQGIADAGS